MPSDRAKVALQDAPSFSLTVAGQPNAFNAHRKTPEVGERCVHRNIRLRYVRFNCPFAARLESWSSAFQAAPRKTITAESCIHTIKPITAARPPYTIEYGTFRT